MTAMWPFGETHCSTVPPRLSHVKLILAPSHGSFLANFRCYVQRLAMGAVLCHGNVGPFLKQQLHDFFVTVSMRCQTL